MSEPEMLEERPLWEQAAEVIPGGSSTGSKQYRALYGESPPDDLPSHYVSAHGCQITLADGRTIVDCGMALGAVSIGYGDSHVTGQALRALGEGGVSSLPPVLEIALADRLTQAIPNAERVRFLKTGAEGVAAAVRLARAATGRSAVVGCGYFGWLDWCSSSFGVPDGVRGDYTALPFNDAQALRDAVARLGSSLAAIVLEPVVGDMMSEEYAREARALADQNGTVLIFDEVKTGFRLHLAGYQGVSGVIPDLAVYGKALANGFPLSAVTGSAAVMDAAGKSWISSTMACESGSLAAAGAVLDLHEEFDVCKSLAEAGSEMRRRVESAVRSAGLPGVSVRGLDPMWYLHFESGVLESAFLGRALGYGVLFKRGPYNFPSLAHDDDALEQIEYAASTALVDLKEAGRYDAV